MTPPTSARSTYMDLTPGTPLRDIAVDTVFIGSCTNGRLEDLRAAADVLRGRQVAAGVDVLIVPGSAEVKERAEAEGLDEVFTTAGAEWRGAGCSMCLGDEPRQARARRAQRVDVEPQLRGPARPGRPHPPGVAPGRRRNGRHRPPDRTGRSVEESTSMEKFTTHTGRAVPLRRSNVDTDQIIPAEFLKRVSREPVSRTGCSRPGADDPSFVLNDNRYDGATILVAGPDFGTGSSREHAVWALQDHGFRAVISPRFADIFRGNALKGGLLPVAAPRGDVVVALQDIVEADPTAEITVDLVERTVRAPGITADFEIDDYTRWRLMEGLDDIGLTLTHADDIAAFEATDRSWMPVTA